jgi:hypothetical protein
MLKFSDLVIAVISDPFYDASRLLLLMVMLGVK